MYTTWTAEEKPESNNFFEGPLKLFLSYKYHYFFNAIFIIYRLMNFNNNN